MANKIKVVLINELKEVFVTKHDLADDRRFGTLGRELAELREELAGLREQVEQLSDVVQVLGAVGSRHLVTPRSIGKRAS